MAKKLSVFKPQRLRNLYFFLSFSYYNLEDTVTNFERHVQFPWYKILLLNENKKTCKANPAGENSSVIFTVCVKSVPLYHFKLAYVVLHMAVKRFF